LQMWYKIFVKHENIMPETYGNYSATVVDAGEGITCEIDVRPPFVPSRDLLDLCRDECGVELKHFVSTPNTTRFGANITDESLSAEIRDVWFRNAAAFLVKVLQSVDEGRDIMHMDFSADRDPNAE
jgi:hypothetical protein